jgi:hypothetical protein
MVFIRGFDDPAATLWIVMLMIQSLPYLATVLTACLSATSYRRVRAEAPVTIEIAPAPTPEPLLTKAA